MHKKNYTMLAFANLVLGVCAICLYLPYTLDAFNIKGFGWLNFAKDIFKNNYFDVLIYFGLFLLAWFIVLNAFSLLSHANLPKFVFKISTIASLLLPLIYVLALKYDGVLEFWIKNIAPNVKTICYVLLSVAWGGFIVGLIFNFTRSNKANLHHIVQALVMSVLLTLLVAINGWCGWDVNNIVKLFGVLMALFAIYLPISTIILMVCRKDKYR